jgi:hypothetical protein
MCPGRPYALFDGSPRIVSREHRIRSPLRGFRMAVLRGRDSMYRIQAGRRRADIYSIMVEPRPAGATIGVYRGLPVAEQVVDLFDRRYSFVGVIGMRSDGQYDVDALKPGQFIVEPGLVYEIETSVRRGRQRALPGSHEGVDKPVLTQIGGALGLFLSGALAIQLLLRIFHAG